VFAADAVLEDEADEALEVLDATLDELLDEAGAELTLDALEDTEEEDEADPAAGLLVPPPPPQP